MFSVKLSGKTVHHWIDSTGPFINLFDLLIDDCAAYWRKVIKKTKHMHIVFLHVTPVNEKTNLNWPVVDWNDQKTNKNIEKEYRPNNTGGQDVGVKLFYYRYTIAQRKLCAILMWQVIYFIWNTIWLRCCKVVWDWKRPHLANKLLGNTGLLLKMKLNPCVRQSYLTSTILNFISHKRKKVTIHKLKLRRRWNKLLTILIDKQNWSSPQKMLES